MSRDLGNELGGFGENEDLFNLGNTFDPEVEETKLKPMEVTQFVFCGLDGKYEMYSVRNSLFWYDPLQNKFVRDEVFYETRAMLSPGQKL